MDENDYAHQRVNPEEQRQSDFIKFVKKHRLGLWIPTSVFAAAVTVAILPTDSRQYNNYSNNKTNSQQITDTLPTAQKTPNELESRIHFEWLLSPENEWTGTQLSIDRAVIEKWAMYAPVKITIPEMNYSAHFPVDRGAKSVKTTFPNSLRLDGKTYNYIVFGRDPLTGNTKELYKNTLRPK